MIARSKRDTALVRRRLQLWSVLGAISMIVPFIVAMPAQADTARVSSLTSDITSSADVRSHAALVDASAFQPGNLISDASFYNRNAMSESAIQEFLAARGSVLASYRSSFSSRPAAISSSSRPGYVYCDPVAGGTNLLASTLIHRIQQACGISARVILVTLQKERGLITKSASTATEADFKVAMGYGCPDTAPCDVTHYGFGNQVYMASYQFRAYQLPENGFTFRPGTRYIQWHPNAACGGSNVNIQNWATAGLYNYTPYQPNAAALAAYPGEGNSCSSYGNRNFWFFYNEWFGPSSPVDGGPDIDAHFSELGGESGVLGSIVTPHDCTLGGLSCVQVHENGAIYWSIARGAKAVVGDFHDTYLAAGGPGGFLGYPATIEQDQEGTDLDGRVQAFSGGSIYSSSLGAFAIPTHVRALYWQFASTRGEYGWPVGDYECDASNRCSQEFEGGLIFSAANTAIRMEGAIGEKYASLGGPDSDLGYPVVPSAPQAGGSNGDGFAQGFENGSIYASDLGAFAVKNPIRAMYWQLASTAGNAGWPTADEQCESGYCAQEFQHATLAVSPSGSLLTVTGAVAEAYHAIDGHLGPLGYPTNSGAAQPGGANGDGFAQAFQGGSIYSGPEGAFSVRGDIRAQYWSAGSTRGYLGWPTAEQVCNDAGCSQQFQGGVVLTASAGTAFPILPAVGSAYIALGGPTGLLGQPTNGGAVQGGGANGDGFAQAFQGGSIYAGPPGAFSVRGEIRAQYWVAGSTRGSLGWPIAEQVCDDAGCSQKFQAGMVFVSSGGASYSILSAVADAYLGLGGPAGVMGYPTNGGAVQGGGANGDGFAQAFQGGSIYAGPPGAFSVRGEIRAQYWVAGSTRGSLGWPIAEQVCDDAGCSQKFQGGMVFVSSGGASYSILSAVADAYLGLGGPAGVMGYPTNGGAVQGGGANGDGFAQAFQGGSIYAGPPGAFSVRGEIRAQYWVAGSTRGSLGWPIAEQVCDDAGCSQKFQGGTLSTGP